MLSCIRVKESLYTHGKNFISLGKENVANVVREMTYDNPLDLERALKHIEYSFDFRSAKVEKESRKDNWCYFSKNIMFRGDSINICIDSLSSSIFTKKIQLRNNQTGYLVLEKEFHFISGAYDSYGYFVLVSVLFLFAMFFLSYSILIKRCFRPFIDIAAYLHDDDKSRLNLHCKEVVEIYNAVIEHKKVVSLKTAIDAATGVFHDFKEPHIVLVRKVKNLALKIKKAHSIESVIKVVESFENEELNGKIVKSPNDMKEMLNSVFKVFEIDSSLFTIKGECEKVFVDPNKISRVFSNLISNGLEQFSKLGISPRFEVIIEKNNKKAIVSLITVDTHIEEKLIINKFINDRNKRYGQGLGLWLVRRFIEQHSGSIQCINLDKGVCFRIVLPLGQEK